MKFSKKALGILILSSSLVGSTQAIAPFIRNFIEDHDNQATFVSTLCETLASKSKKERAVALRLAGMMSRPFIEYVVDAVRKRSPFASTEKLQLEALKITFIVLGMVAAKLASKNVFSQNMDNSFTFENLSRFNCLYNIFTNTRTKSWAKDALASSKS